MLNNKTLMLPTFYLKLSRSAFFDCVKCILNKTHHITLCNIPLPHHTPHPSHEIIWAYLTQITHLAPPFGGLKSKKKNTYVS